MRTEVKKMRRIYKVDDKNINTDMQSILVSGTISKILIETDDKYTIAMGDGLELKEGYVLNVQEVSIEDHKVLLELTKDGNVVDTKVVYSSIDDDAYVYDGESPDGKDKYPLIIARIDAISRGTDINVVTIGGVFQASDTTTNIKTCSKYDELEVTKSKPNWKQEICRITDEMLQTKYGNAQD